MYRLVIGHIHGEFIVLSHWETRPPAPWPNIPLSHIILIVCLLLFYVQATSEVGYRLVTVGTRGDFIVLPNGKPGHQHHDLISHSVTVSWHRTNKSLPYPNNAKCQARKWQVSIFKSLIWLDQGLNIWVWISRSTKAGVGRSTHSAILPGLKILGVQ